MPEFRGGGRWFTVPFNTAIVKGYNGLMGAKVKLGRWDQYLAVRQGILALNDQYRTRLSNDLGAIAGFLFDLSSGRYPLPPADDTPKQEPALKKTPDPSTMN